LVIADFSANPLDNEFVNLRRFLNRKALDAALLAMATGHRKAVLPFDEVKLIDRLRFLAPTATLRCLQRPGQQFLVALSAAVLAQAFGFLNTPAAENAEVARLDVVKAHPLLNRRLRDVEMAGQFPRSHAFPDREKIVWDRDRKSQSNASRTSSRALASFRISSTDHRRSGSLVIDFGLIPVICAGSLISRRVLLIAMRIVCFLATVGISLISPPTLVQTSGETPPSKPGASEDPVWMEWVPR